MRRLSLRESEEKFRNLFNNSEIGIFRSRLDGSEVLDVNDKFLDIVGRTREEIEGKALGDTLGRPERARGDVPKTCCGRPRNRV